ncbi:hypothetical protein TREMEDRAFT_71904 [Tremella mesenterica DSM 1558]|nr:uncharacterized protein TREMEDRAFT_71904 [Tremella mesenterica DSM 1558]EIW68748.1 hypothetical protein TREMEDRAFT_71904 [Tremella mesenterica DSM 1558]
MLADQSITQSLSTLATEEPMLQIRILGDSDSLPPPRKRAKTNKPLVTESSAPKPLSRKRSKSERPTQLIRHSSSEAAAGSSDLTSVTKRGNGKRGSTGKNYTEDEDKLILDLVTSRTLSSETLSPICASLVAAGFAERTWTALRWRLCHPLNDQFKARIAQLEGGWME